MKKMKFIFIIFSVIFLLTACVLQKNIDKVNTVYYDQSLNYATKTFNEMTGKVAEFNNEVYYIKGNNLYYNQTSPELFKSNVFSVQSDNDKLYYTEKASNNMMYLMQYKDNEHFEITELPSGYLKKVIVSGTHIYVIVDNKLYLKNNKNSDFLLIKSDVYDFVLDGENIYCAIFINNRSENEQEPFVADLSESNIFHKIVLLKNQQKEKLVAKNKTGFMLAPGDNGVIYYNRDEHTLQYYKNNKSITLDKGMVTNIFSYDNSVVYTMFHENSIYKLSLSDNTKEKIFESTENITGFSNGKFYIEKNGLEANERWIEISK